MGSTPRDREGSVGPDARAIPAIGARTLADMPVPDVAVPVPTPALIERAAAFRAAHWAAPPARPAASVILLREAETGGGIEVFMLRRVTAMAFAPGMHVFPGGVVDASDGSLDADPAAASLTAAVRETFEETGVLLAAADSEAADPSRGDDELEGERLAVIAREMSFDDLLARRGLVVRSTLVQPWSHWITPEFEPRRYDTRFYVARLPPTQLARDVGGESDAAGWARPLDALAAQKRGEWALMPPTEMTLRELTRFDSSAAVFAEARGRHITPVLPTIDLEADPPRFLFTEPSPPFQERPRP